MAISLKEQLHQALQISEAVSYPGIQYHAPPVNVLKKGMEDSHTRKQATQLFYDFYAMNLMHSLVGKPPKDPSPDMSDPVIRNAAEMGASEQDLVNMQKYKNAMGAYPEHSGAGLFVNWGDVENLPAGVSPAPTALRRVVEHVYRQVVRQITSKMMAHLRLTLVQEFRYLVTHAKDWQSFRQRLVAIFNKGGGKVSKQEFENAISEKVPGLKNHNEAVRRLLKFCKYYSPMHPDPGDAVSADVTSPSVGKPVSAEPEPEPELEPEPEEPPKAQEPDPDDKTDYDMPSVEIPPGADWGDEPYDYSSDIEKEKVKQWLKQKKKLHEGIHDPSYAAGRISPHTILAVKQAIQKSGLTWDDIILAYKNLNWGGAYGGPKWGIGAEAFVKLVAQAKNNNTEDMAGLIDHIYDLEHNTGDLLNKGGMYVSSADLDRRSKVTSLSRYLDSVSPLVQRLILRVLKFTAKHPEIERDIQKVTQSPTQPFSQEEATQLAASKFVKSSAGEEWTTQAPYKNKKDETVQNQYTAKHHTNGMYSVQDTINADVQTFDTWEEFKEWIGRNENDFIKPTVGAYTYEPLKSLSEKDQFLAGKTKIKLDAEKETKLLEECKMAWRPSNHYYKAYLPGDDRFQFFAFSDGTLMGCIKSTKKIGAILNDWHTAFIYCQGQTANALPNQEYEEGKAWIGKAIDAPPPSVAPSSTWPHSPSVGSVPATEYTLSPVELNMLQILATNYSGVTVVPNVMPEGVTAFKIQIEPGDGNLLDFNVLTVGKKALSSTGKKYVVKHAVFGKEMEEWSFANWNQTYSFLTNNFSVLTQAATPVTGTVSAVVTPQIFATATNAPLPPNSTSKAAYKVHLGIQKPPSHTIRLTADDENMLKAVGFEPKMIGSDVWYIHKPIGDTVKFFPNDIAKILFIKTNNKAIITKKIDDALAWLQVHYAGATASPIAVTPTGPTKGSKAGAMYEKILADAGFEWEPNNGIYVNKDNPDTVLISPFPQSTVVTPEGKKKFTSLPQLAVFLKGYNGLKKKY